MLSNESPSESVSGEAIVVVVCLEATLSRKVRAFTPISGLEAYRLTFSAPAQASSK